MLPPVIVVHLDSDDRRLRVLDQDAECLVPSRIKIAFDRLTAITQLSSNLELDVWVAGA